MSDKTAAESRKANVEIVQRLLASDPAWVEWSKNRPLCGGHHVVDLQTAFDFSIAVLNLRAEPGDLILDLGSGCCWASEWLNRLRFRTVSLDISVDSLKIGQERLGLDSRLSRDLANFVTGDAEELPFADESFDGVVCISSFHHLSDYEKALREIRRVLKQGRRAVFSEPGCTHSQRVSSLQAEAEFGTPERDIHLPELFGQARRAGFELVCLEPYVYPCNLTLSEEDWDGLKKGEGRILDKYVGTLVRSVEEDHPTVVMVKGGSRGLDSRYPHLLRADIELLEFPGTVTSGELLQGKVLVRNTGDTPWLAAPQEAGGHVTLGLKALTRDGRVVSDSLYRAALPRNLSPGEEGEIALAFVIGLAPGSYQLKFDMVDELICWFEEGGSSPRLGQLTVMARSEERGLVEGESPVDTVQIGADDVDVKALVRQIREQVAQRGVEARAEQQLLVETQEELWREQRESWTVSEPPERVPPPSLEECEVVPGEYAIDWQNPILGPLNAQLRKIINAELRAYVRPMLEKQTHLNYKIKDLFREVHQLRLDLHKLSREADEHVALENARQRQNDVEMASLRDGWLFGLAEFHELPEMDYFVFEEEHRGSENEILERQRAYLQHFRGCRNVVDLGCGRGEFLELLRSEGVGAVGVDVDSRMVQRCRSKGLKVYQADALSYLESLADRTV
ncbi:MAG: methyltransferase domain-containing protein, partial [Chloroflexi bacterium]|nr:methyltransferase domain-containing protein [Chloroflexota bacterium]